MFREAWKRRESKNAHGFRMRGHEITRLESFSDAVFAFALTLLVVSLEVPKSFAELFNTMRGFVAFGVCFAILARIWNAHYVYCRRFGLDDGFVRFLTCVLLFIVLLYVYPLKFLFTLFINKMLLGIETGQPQITSDQAATLFVIYGVGFCAVHIALAFLYLRAYRLRDDLDLNALERLSTRWEIYGLLCKMGIGLISAGLAIILHARDVVWAGFVYFSLFAIMRVHGSLHSRRRRDLRARLVTAEM